VGEKKGSNEGGTYQHADSDKYYVKFPKNPDQAKTEVLSARLAEAMGIKTTSPDWEKIDGKIAVASKMQKLTSVNWHIPDATIAVLNPTQRLQLAKMYYHAKLTKNWDVLGLDSSNIMMDDTGNLVQMDTGGSFKFRAQGEAKDYGADPDDTNLLDPNLPSGKVFNALMQKDPAAFKIALGDLKNKIKPDEIELIFYNSDLDGNTSLQVNFAQRYQKLTNQGSPVANNAPKPVAKPFHQVTSTELDQKYKLIDTPPEKWPKKGEPGYLDTNQRLRLASKIAYESSGGIASRLIAASIKVPPPPVTPENRNAVSDYVGSSTALNRELRLAKNNSVEALQHTYAKKVKVLDETLSQARDYSMPVKVMRGMPTNALPADIKPGDTFVDHGYQSTSFSGEVAKSFGSQNTVLRITLPKGFKFLAVPAFARAAEKDGHTFSSHAGTEAECILPRGTGYKVKKIEQEGALKVLHVHAVFSSLQPPGTPWMSTRSAKAKQSQEPGSGSVT
jgi:hypothetical protein